MDVKEIKKKLLLDIEKLKTSQGYLNAGYPNYNTLFGRDSLIAAWQLLEIDPKIAKSTLQILAKYQGKNFNQKSEEEPGKILHEYRFTSQEQAELLYWQFPYFGSVDATPLFIIVAKKYFQKTGDREFLVKIWPNIRAAVNWISKYGDADNDNFIEYQRKNPQGLFHQGWRDSQEDHLKIKPPVALVEVQGYSFAAYQAAADLAQKLEKDFSLSDLWLNKAEELQHSFQKYFWWPEESYYYLALDANKKPRKSVCSNSGHLLFTGIIDETLLPKIISRLFSSDLWTPWGIRTLSITDPDFNPQSYHLGSIWPHDNWMIYYGLKALGFLEKAQMIKQSLLLVYQELGFIPELFKVGESKIVLSTKGKIPANPLQAWASSGLLNMIWED